MLLVIDVGNTNTVLGLYAGRKLRRTWRVPSASRSILGLALTLPRGIESMTVSSVVPGLRSILRSLAVRLGVKRPLFVSHRMPLPIRIKVPHPEKVGVDRIVNAVAAYQSYCGRDLMVIDFGTATTFDVVTSRGAFIGGAIAPGLKTIAEALSSRCAQLPRIPLKKPKRVTGRTTTEAMQSGVFLGYVTMVEGMIERFKKEIGLPLLVVATGGLSSRIARHAKAIDQVDPNLTLDGLLWITTGQPKT